MGMAGQDKRTSRWSPGSSLQGGECPGRSRGVAASAGGQGVAQAKPPWRSALFSRVTRSQHLGLPRVCSAAHSLGLGGLQEDTLHSQTHLNGSSVFASILITTFSVPALSRALLGVVLVSCLEPRRLPMQTLSLLPPKGDSKVLLSPGSSEGTWASAAAGICVVGRGGGWRQKWECTREIQRHPHCAQGREAGVQIWLTQSRPGPWPASGLGAHSEARAAGQVALEYLEESAVRRVSPVARAGPTATAPLMVLPLGRFSLLKADSRAVVMRAHVALS